MEQHVVDQDNQTHITDLCRAHVQYGRAFLITERMSGVVQRRSQDTDRLPPMTHCPADVEPPRRSGFAVFEEPVPIPEIRGRLQLCHATTWGPGYSRNRDTGVNVHGWLLTTWNDIARDPDEVSRITLRMYPEKARPLGRWWPVHSLFLPQDQRLGDVDRPIYDAERAELETKYGTEPPIATDVLPNPRRLHVALWQLLSETVHTHGTTTEEIGYPDRGAFRMARRLGMDSDITVITLRRPAEPTLHPGTGKPLDHRVPVCQRVRHYWVRGADGVLRREPRIIGAHERGPEGTPLIVTKRLEGCPDDRQSGGGSSACTTPWAASRPRSTGNG